MIRTLRFVRRHDALLYCQLGWIIVVNTDGLPPLVEAPHGEWSVMMEWLCTCPACQPLRQDATLDNPQCKAIADE